MTQKIRLFLTIISLLFLSNCASRLHMKPEDFSTLKEGQRVVAYKLKFTHDNQIMNNNPLANRGSWCRLHFSKNGKIFSNFYQYKSNSDYIFVLTKDDEIYLSGARCAQYKVLYNKSRFKKTDSKISSLSDKSDKINYGGDIEIDWIPEIFQVNDLLNLGDLNNHDNGSFSMRITEDYAGYLDFMKSNYDFDKDKSINAFDQNISNEISKLNSQNLISEKPDIQLEK